MFGRVVAMVILSGGMVLALSEHHEGSHSEGSHSEHAAKGAVAYPCPMLQSQHDQMTQKMAAMDLKVTQLAQAMKQSQGEQKMKSMEALLSTLVEQRTTIHEEMVSMMPKMMQWVSSHSGAGSHECSEMSASSSTSTE